MDLPDNAIEARGLFKTYPATRQTPAMAALKGIDLTIPRGSIFGLLGPNGAGKSTFINILAGLTRKTEGTVRIWGRDIDERPRDARAAIGVVPQEIAADVFFTPRESLEVQAGLYGVPKGERRTDELLRALGLSDKADAYVRQLSGGMKRRLMVAKAMVHNPPVLVLDEPTAGVDVELRRDMWRQIGALRDKGTTIVLTTHYIEEAQEMADRVGVINKGELLLVEDKAVLMEKLGKKQLILQLQSPLSEVPTELAGYHLEPAEDGNKLVFTYDAQRERSTIAGLLRKLGELGIEFKDLQTQESSLEEIFVSLVRSRS